jgi:Flp pilus assembly protein CpaB
VLAADGTTGESGSRARNSEAKVNAEAATITLALRPEEAQKLYLADANGRIRLTVRPYSEPTEVRPIDSMVETDLFPRNLPNPFIR